MMEVRDSSYRHFFLKPTVSFLFSKFFFETVLSSSRRTRQNLIISIPMWNLKNESVTREGRAMNQS